ncbi:hypothetical protein [Noviherbaspirillum cavernae]|uniref:hypothetical protein n=1 Tax=Noviherbaspirillum cavernae TaxID=2320862 RepID=UPI0011C3A1F7|nr:hypothetical protein [Noviherbaspirillum cavernae]
MTRIAPIPRQKCSQGLGLAALFSLSRRDFITFICNQFPTQDTGAFSGRRGIAQSGIAFLETALKFLHIRRM